MNIDTHKILGVAAAVGAVLLASGCGGSSSDSASTTTTGAAAATTTTATASAATTAGAYKAGTYDAEGKYTNPAGPAQVGVEVTIDGAGTVSAVKVTPEATGGNSLQFQTQFANGISSEVVGKKIDSLQVTKVSGSSLTGNGFNAAIQEIITEAKA
jgi:uncharacterized protein with FMN-binding domain